MDENPVLREQIGFVGCVSPTTSASSTRSPRGETRPQVVERDCNHRNSRDGSWLAQEADREEIVSWDGRTNWQALTSVAWPITDLSESPAYRLRAFVGRFGDTAGGDLLNVDFTRYAKIFDKATRTFAPHSISAY